MESLLLVLIFVLMPLIALLMLLLLIEVKHKKELHELKIEILKKIISFIPTKQEKDKKETK